MKLAEVAGGIAKLYDFVAAELFDALKKLEEEWPNSIDVTFSSGYDSTYKLPTIGVYIETPQIDKVAAQVGVIMRDVVPVDSMHPCKTTVHTVSETMGKALYHITVGPP